MSAGEERAPLSPLELRQGTKAVTEVFADREWFAVPADGPVSAELRRRAVERRYRWQLEVSGP